MADGGGKRPTNAARHLHGADGPGRRRAGVVPKLIGAVLVLALLAFALVRSGMLQRLVGGAPETSEAADAPSSSQDSGDELVLQDREATAQDLKLSGWQQDETGAWRYYDPETHELHHGWLELDGERYFCDEKTGEQQVGWLELDGRSYWFSDGGQGPEGTLVCNTWFDHDDQRYHLSEEGAADEGWCELDGATYCFDDVGAMRTGWATGEDGKQRWLKPEDGTMATHEWVQIEDLWEPFDDDGSWVTNGETIPPNDEADMANLSARQQAVIAACDTTPWPGKALCAGWVSNVFAQAGEPSVGGDACDIARAWCISDDLAYLKPGMVIAVASHSRTENGRIWGHVCVYVGGGIVRDSGTYGIRRIQLGSWLAWFGVTETPRWGWANGIELV